MSLKGFHIVFVVATVSLAVFFAYWSYGQYQLTQSAGFLLGAFAAVVLGIGFVTYGIIFARKIKG